MKRVIFVDNEPNVLSGLRRILHPLREEWSMHFVETAESAAEQLGAEAFDVVVSELHVKDATGTPVLQACHDRWPSVVRVAFSASANLESVAQSMATAHQFLAKPCDADTIRDMLARAAEIQGLIRDPRLRDHLGEMQSVPVFPRTYNALNEALRDPDVSLSELAAILESDPVLMAKILQLVNSAAMGVPMKVTDLVTAVGALGIEVLRSFVLFVEISHCMEGANIASHFSMPAHLDHSMAVARLAEKIAGSAKLRREAFTIGMLHDIGDMVLAIQMPEVYDEITETAREQKQDRKDLEFERFGTTHAEIGAYLLGLWGVPHSIMTAVSHHHRPRVESAGEMTAELAVHVANAILHDLKPLPNRPRKGGLDPDAMATLGFESAIDEWYHVARETLYANEETTNA